MVNDSKKAMWEIVARLSAHIRNELVPVKELMQTTDEGLAWLDAHINNRFDNKVPEILALCRRVENSGVASTI